MKQKLAYLVSQYPGISHTFILREVRGLRALGFSIQVASVNLPDRGDADLAQEEREEKDKTFYIKQAGVSGAVAAHVSLFIRKPLKYLKALFYALSLGGLDLKKVAYGFFYFVEAVMLGRWLEKTGVSNLHVHFATPASTVAMILTRLQPITFSLTVHGPDEFYDVPGYLLKEKVEAAAFVCCIGQYARSQLMRLSDPSHWNKFEVAPLGVDISQFAPRVPRQDPGPFEAICVGRLVPAKGQHILVGAIRLLKDQGREIKLRFVGDGPDRQSLESMVQRLGIEDSVIFEGKVNQDRIRDLYARADAFVLASFAEGIPVVLMEAMAMEIPCVTTCITGIPELIRDGIDGFLVSPSSREALATALGRLIDDPNLRKQIGAAGRNRVAEKYNLEINIPRLGEVFKRRLEPGAE